MSQYGRYGISVKFPAILIDCNRDDGPRPIAEIYMHFLPGLTHINCLLLTAES